MEFLQQLVNFQEVEILFGLFIGLITTGVFTAMLAGVFDKGKFFAFGQKLWPGLVLYLLAGLMCLIGPDWYGFQTTVFVGLCTLMSDKILKNLKEQGLPVPNGLWIVDAVANKVVGKPVSGALTAVKLKKPKE